MAPPGFGRPLLGNQGGNATTTKTCHEVNAVYMHDEGQYKHFTVNELLGVQV